MKRRNFIKGVGAASTVGIIPSLSISSLFTRQAMAAPMINAVNFAAPSVLPQVINIFLYGGPSELAGNLTNIADINANSQNPYPGNLLRATTDNNGRITSNGFWSDAGGNEMEDMLATNDLTVYRTLNRLKRNTRAHRPSVFSSQMGNLDIDTSSGIGNTLATVLFNNRAAIESSGLISGGRTIEQLVLPFVSFEGDTVAFRRNPDYVALPQSLKDISLDDNFNNPYSRANNPHDTALEALVAKILDPTMRARYDKVTDGFDTRSQLDSLVGDFETASQALPNVGIGDPDADANGVLQYPANNRYTDRLRAATTLAIANPDSMYITVGGGLGGWDDHNSAFERYIPRMRDLMRALRVAMKHIRFSDISQGGTRDTNNIIINVHGDFGRNVNLNNSQGWDHGNNQSFYTLGGSTVRTGGAAALGKVVGATERFGNSGQNRQFTRPTNSSYQAEPISVASSIYSYFGVTNPEVLTQDAQYAINGEPPLDETVAGEAPMFP